MKLTALIFAVLLFECPLSWGENSCPTWANQQESVKAAFSRYLRGEMSKSDFAAFCHRQGLDMTQETDTRYRLLSGAFRCYMELGEIANARDVVVTMMGQELPRQDILDLLRESNIYFGVNCFDYGCPQILDSIYRAGQFFKPTDVTISSLEELDFGPLKLPSCNLSNAIETVITCLPLPDRENGAMICTTKCVRVNVASIRSNVDGVKLYLTPTTEEIFQMEFLLSRPSYVRDKEFERELNDLIGLLSARFSVDMSVIKFNAKANGNKDDGHLIGKDNTLYGDGLFHDSFETEYANIGDYGVGPLRINGSWYEDVHHFKFVRIRIADKEKLSVARREIGSKKICLTRKISVKADDLSNLDFDLEYLCVGDFLNAAVRYEIKSRNLGAKGCRAERSKPDVAAWWYDRASLHGNPMASKWLARHPDVANLRVGRKTIYGLEVGKLLSGVQLDATGLAPHFELTDFKRWHLMPYNIYCGAIFGVVGNKISGMNSGLILSGLFNINTDMSIINGIQIAGLYNVGYGATCNGVLMGGANVAFDSVCNGLDVTVACDVQGIMNGAQISWVCGSCELNGLSVASYGSYCGSVAGVQIAGIANFVLKDIPLPEWGQGFFPGDEEISNLPWGDGVVRGVQVAGLLNYVGDKVYGIQIGAVNYAKQLSGVQIGIVNIVAEGGIFFMPVMNMNF